MVRLLTLIALAISCYAATFGTVTALTGGVVDIVLDASRQRLYLVGVPDKIEVYSIAQRRFLTAIRTDALPLAAAMSRDARTLYVACHNSSTINVIDLDQMAVVNRINLPSRPEAVAVGLDGKVVITTIGTGVNNTQNTLLVYDPTITDTRALTALAVVPPTPASPAATTGPLNQANRSFLVSSADGRYIVGVNLPNTATRAVYVYEVASSTILRARTVGNISNVVAVSNDGTKLMSGPNLFETATLAALAQHTVSNVPYPMVATANLNLQATQGGSVFSPDGRTVYTAFNVAPTQNPAARANISQLQIADADNLQVTMGVQLPENLTGKMVITPDGATIFAASESGFVTIPIGQLTQSPIAAPVSRAVLLANDQCGIVSSQRRGSVVVRNMGAGRVTASATALASALLPAAGVLPGGGANTLPAVQTVTGGEGPTLNFTYNATNAASLGSASPADVLIQSSEAVNIPNTVRVYQNNRDAESRGEIVTFETGIVPTEGLVDIVYDATRRRIYIANSGMNRVEVFDERTRTVLAPIKVGQLPRSMALSPDGNFLYVGNSGSEYVSVIDAATGRVTGRINFPPMPVLANLPFVYPTQIAATQRGLLVVMNNGTLWTSVGDQLVPRASWNILGTATLPAPRTMAAAPTGEYALVMNGNGAVYLYDAVADDIVQSRTVFTGTGLQGYYGAISVGPRGAYYVVNGTVLNQALTPVSSASAPGQPATASIASVVAVAANQYARFSVPVRANATAAVTTLPGVEIVNPDTGAVARRLGALEGPLTPALGTSRAAVDGRTMVLDAAGTNAYVLTASGLSIVSLEAIPTTDRPTVSTGGVVSLGSYTTDIAAGAIVSIFGRSLAGTTQAASTTPLPTVMDGVCVTLNNTPLPIYSISGGQINVQIPFERTAGAFPLIIRDANKRLASTATTVRVVRAAPVVLVDPASGQAAIYDSNARPVNKNNPTTRDRRLVIYALGMGPTTRNPAAGAAASATNLAEVVDDVKVFFGDKRYSQAEMIVEWAGLVPNFVGLYQINIYVPGDRLRGEDLDVTVRVGTVENKFVTGVRPSVAVE